MKILVVKNVKMGMLDIELLLLKMVLFVLNPIMSNSETSNQKQNMFPIVRTTEMMEIQLFVINVIMVTYFLLIIDFVLERKFIQIV